MIQKIRRVEAGESDSGRFRGKSLKGKEGKVLFARFSSGVGRGFFVAPQRMPDLLKLMRLGLFFDVSRYEENKIDPHSFFFRPRNKSQVKNVAQSSVLLFAQDSSTLNHCNMAIPKNLPQHRRRPRNAG